jgi:glycosyltransferase involved in cell wall biosynthesis
VLASLGGTYPFRIGGPSVVAYNLARQFDRKGIQISFVFGISKKDFPDAYQELSARFSRNVGLIPIVKNPRSERSYKASFDSEFILNTRRVTSTVADHPDVIQFASPPSSSDALLPLLARLKRIPSVVRLPGLHRYEAKYRGNLSTYESYLLYRLTRSFFTRVVCASSFMKDMLISDGIDHKKICVIPNGIDLDTFANAGHVELVGEPALLFVGRLEQEKGIDILVQSMPHLTRVLPRVALHVVGTGSLDKELRSYVVREGLTDRVLFYGKKAETAVFYNSADICVIPSFLEGFGITAIEAMAAGKPVVATRCGGIPENITNLENGILIRPCRLDLVKAIADLWNDANLVERIGQNNLQKAKRFDWSRVADEYIRLYMAVTEFTE